MANTSEFSGVTHFGKDTPNKIIKTSLMEFFNWGFLQIRAFVDVSISASGLYGGNQSVLRPVKDPNYTNGRVWEGFRQNWVWESGLNSSPIAVSGVYVSGTFYPTSGSSLPHIIDYPRGRVIFNSPIPTGSPVKAEYSYKYINVVDADTVPFFQELQTNSLRIDSEQFGQFASGDLFKIGDTRLQPPIVAIEVPSQTSFRPYEIGHGSWATKHILCHVITEDGGQVADKIADIISMQEERAIFGIDTNKLATDNKFPLTYSGTIASGAMTYPQMTSGEYRWKQMYITEAEITNSQRLSTRLHISTVRLEVDVVLDIP
jgi:hypothetical protein